MWRLVGVFLLAVALAPAAACGSSDAPPPSTVAVLVAVPQAVLTSVSIIADAARGGDPELVADLAAAGFEFDFARPDVALLDYLGSDDGELLRRLVAVLESAPGRRQSPFGNGAIQELWVYPALALEPVSDWAPQDIDEALVTGLFSSEELAAYIAADAYLGYSVGVTPEGEWVFFVEGQVSNTPR